MKTDNIMNQLSETEQKDLLARLKDKNLTSAEYDLLILIVGSYFKVMKILQSKRTLFRKIRQILFGNKTEKIPSPDKLPSSSISDVSESSIQSSIQEESFSISSDSSKYDSNNNDNKAIDVNNNKTNLKRKGGRHSHDDYKGANTIFVPHENLKAGEPCPCCPNKLLRKIDDGSVVVFCGQAPISADVLKLDRFICDGCSKTYTSKMPADVPKKESSANSIVAILNHSYGFPYYRLESLEKSFGIPISDSKLQAMTLPVYDAALPIFQYLLKLASRGDSFFNDDTPMRVLSHKKKLRTSIVLSTVEQREIVLYFTGEKTARDNLGKILNERPKNLERPFQMCDASTQSWGEELDVTLCFCLDHCRRLFWYLIHDENPCNKSLYILELIRQIYVIDGHAKNMTPEERLEIHRKQAIPILNKINTYLEDGLEQRDYEPNSDFGKAASYLLKHWNRLTQFVRYKGAAISNSSSERGLKISAIRRKNSYFFKTLKSAFEGDVLSSLIETSKRCKINLQHYFTVIQIYKDLVCKKPEDWLPWNYHLNSIKPI